MEDSFEMNCVTVDMILEATRSAQGHLSVQGPMRAELKSRGIRSKIVNEVGPGGGNPEVMLIGSRTALLRFLKDNEYDLGAHAIEKV
jgi:hypothetical protein